MDGSCAVCASAAELDPTAMSTSTFLTRPLRSLIGIGVILAGVPVYAWFEKRRTPTGQAVAIAPEAVS